MMAEELKPEGQDAVDRIRIGINAGVPSLYVNGFALIQTVSDVAAVLEKNGEPVAIINMSFTTAKTLAQKLGGVIAKLEDRAGRMMLTTDDISALASEAEKRELK
jgi:hypothetical protein